MSIVVHLFQEGRDIGCLMIAELVVVSFECGSCVGKKSVVAFSFSLFLLLSVLLFRFCLVCGVFGGKEGHVVQSGGVCCNLRSQDV